MVSALLLGGLATAAPTSPPQTQLEVRDVIPLGGEHGHVVMLVTKDQEKVIPLMVDTQAALAIAFRLSHRSSPYRLSEDLLDDVVKDLGGHVTRVDISRVEGDIFKTMVHVQQGKKLHRFSARPSDSIAMALSSGATICASAEVIDAASITKEDLMKMHQAPPGDEGPGVGGSGLPSADRPTLDL